MAETDDYREMGSKTQPGRHNIGMSAHAAAAYLQAKLDLLEMEVPWDVSDSAVVEWLVAKMRDPRLNPWTWRPKTRDSRKPSNLPTWSTKNGLPTAHNERMISDRINETIRKRKEKTRERLDFYLKYPDRARAGKRRKARAARRNKDVRSNPNDEGNKTLATRRNRDVSPG